MNFRGIFFACLVLGCADSSGVGDAGNDAGSPTDVPLIDATDAATDAGFDAGALPTGDCDGPEDCESGECVELTPGGWRVCTQARIEVDMCSGEGAGVDECGCDDAPICEGGVACLRGPLTPSCGGIAPVSTNMCAIDACTADADCGEGSICSPERVLGRQVRTCMGAPCRTNANCTDSPGGICAPIADPCCGAAFLGCVYAGGCRTGADCDDGRHCMGGVCSDGDILCPP